MIDPNAVEPFRDVDLSSSGLVSLYSTNIWWSLFLTSTAIHAVALITSPIQAVYKWYRRRSSDSDTCLPYVCAIVPTALWWRYAIFIWDVKLIMLQTYACIMQSIFLFTLIAYRTKKRRLVRVVISMYTMFGLLLYYLQTLSHDDGMIISGRLASGTQIAGSLICPYLIYRAISTRVIDFVPLAPVAFTWIMELHAIVYSLGIDDFYMLLANTTFFCMDGSLLAMFFILPTEKNPRMVKVEVA